MDRLCLTSRMALFASSTAGPTTSFPRIFQKNLRIKHGLTTLLKSQVIEQLQNIFPLRQPFSTSITYKPVFLTKGRCKKCNVLPILSNHIFDTNFSNIEDVSYNFVPDTLQIYVFLTDFVKMAARTQATVLCSVRNSFPNWKEKC